MEKQPQNFTSDMFEGTREQGEAHLPDNAPDLDIYAELQGAIAHALKHARQRAEP